NLDNIENTIIHQDSNKKAIQETNNETLTPENIVDIASSNDVKNLTASVNSYHAEIRSFLEEKFVSLSLGMENILKEIQQRREPAASLDSENAVIDTHFFPISSKTAMYSFEDSLQNDDFQKKVVLHLRKIIGSGFAWIHACYKLAGVMFTKEILVQYSGTGVSRTGLDKDAFNKLNNILGVFYQVIRYSDLSFTYANRETFFRDKLLKHSQSRLHPRKKIKETLSPQVPAQLSSEMVEVLSEETSVGVDCTPDMPS
ncbi:unnamed protein product, partial [Callosobruchus maculatus]